jgi:hypothetical protein
VYKIRVAAMTPFKGHCSMSTLSLLAARLTRTARKASHYTAKVGHVLGPGRNRERR